MNTIDEIFRRIEFLRTLQRSCKQKKYTLTSQHYVQITTKILTIGQKLNIPQKLDMPPDLTFLQYQLAIEDSNRRV